MKALFPFQKKLEAELQQIEEKFEAKKRKFIESSETFQEELKMVKMMNSFLYPVDESLQFDWNDPLIF
jgi:hypothetical protein